MSKHTPGPWTVEEYGDEHLPALVIHKDSETRVCFMATLGSYGDPETIAANARLIAASPRLLSALCELLVLHDLLLARDDLPEDVHLVLKQHWRVKGAKAAIAEAEGTAS